MYDIAILQDLLKKQCPEVHAKRLDSLMLATSSLLDGYQLSLTELGRNITGPVSAKHNIKRMDRLLGNAGFVSVRGRSVILYERTFTFAQYNSPAFHNAFLAELATVLPAGTCPLIVTDAGYRNTWFHQLESMGWFWLGRIRGEVGFQPVGQFLWHSNKSLYPKASCRAKHVGSVQLGRKRPTDCELHLYKAKPKGLKDRHSSKTGRAHTALRSYQTGSKAPW